VHHTIFFLELIKQLGDLIVLRNVTHESRSAGQVRDQVFGLELQSFVLIGDRQSPASLLQLLRNRPRDTALVGQSKNHRCFLRFAHFSPRLIQATEGHPNQNQTNLSPN